jgi:integrase
MARTTRRRSPGEGGAYSYKTAAGLRWYWKAPISQPDGTTKIKTKSGFLIKEDALTAMQDAMVSGRKGEYVEPSKRTVGSWFDEWLDTLRLADSTMASYRRTVRLHIEPHIGDELLSRLTSSRLTRLYRELERGGLGARSVRYVHVVLGAALAAAVEAEPPLLLKSPAVKATPPSRKQAQPAEIIPWNAEQLKTFMGWSAGSSPHHAAWRVLGYTGARRGEVLALRWRHVDLDAATISIQKTVGIVHVKGDSASGKPVESKPKTDKSRRVVDLDPATVAVLKSWRSERASLGLHLVRPDSLVFSDLDGEHLHPERFSRTWQQTQARCRKAHPDLPQIRMHDLRHTHATLLIAAGVPIKVVSERLGHSSINVTLGVYGHVMPGDQKRAAVKFAELVGEAI